MPGVDAHVVLVAVMGLAMLLGPAGILVFLPQQGWLVLPVFR